MPATWTPDEGVQSSGVLLLRQVGVFRAPLCKVQAAGWVGGALGGGGRPCRAAQGAEELMGVPVGSRRGPLDIASHSVPQFLLQPFGISQSITE